MLFEIETIPQGVVSDAPSSAVREQHIKCAFLLQASRGINGPGMTPYLGLLKKNKME